MVGSTWFLSEQMQGHCYPKHMASALISQLNYRSTLRFSHSRCVFCVLIYGVVIACITCCGAVYNLCLVLLLYMYFCACIFQLLLIILMSVGSTLPMAQSVRSWSGSVFPVLLRTYGNWGKEAQNTFSRLASLLSISQCCQSLRSFRRFMVSSISL